MQVPHTLLREYAFFYVEADTFFYYVEATPSFVVKRGVCSSTLWRQAVSSMDQENYWCRYETDWSQLPCGNLALSLIHHISACDYSHV